MESPSISPLPRQGSLSSRRLGRFLTGSTALMLGLVLSLAGLFLVNPAGAELDDRVRNFWGVTGIQAGTTTNVASHIFAIEQIDNTIYVGGKFLEVGPVGSPSTSSQPFIAAFHADNGVFIDWWAPQFNGPVYALRASADGSRLYVGGEFTQVNGATHRSIVALDPASGNVDPTWTTEISGRGNVVRVIELDGNLLYAAGSFDTVTKSGSTTAVQNVTRINTNTGLADTSWRPAISGGGVWGLAKSPNFDRVYLTGFFTTVGGTSQRGWAALSASNGALLTALQYEHNDSDVTVQYLHDVVVANGNVFIGGSQHHTAVIDESSWSLRWSHVTNRYVPSGETAGGGDSQDLEVWQGRVYVSCHCWGHVFSQANQTIHLRVDGVWMPPTLNDRRPVRAVYALDASTGARIDTFQPQFSGIAGPWALKGHSTDGCLWAGGQFTQVDGSSRKHLTRMCDETGPGPAAGPKLINPSTLPTAPLSCTVTMTNHNQVRLDWVRADGDLAQKFIVSRSKDNGAFFWNGAPNAPATSFTPNAVNPGSYRYRVATQSATANSVATTCLFEGGSSVPILALTCGGLPVTIAGTFGNDTLTGTSGRDVIRGLAGNDTINGLDGDDVICGDDGDDVIFGGNGADLVGAGDGQDEVSGGPGADLLYGGLDPDVLNGGDGNDLVNGGSGNDTITGGNGNDRLIGDFGWDTVFGGTGNDTIFGGYGNDFLAGDIGWDVVFGGPGNDRLNGGFGRDTLRGGTGNDVLSGGDENDQLFGDAGNDRLIDGAGDDVLHGSTGDDELHGGAGINTLFGGSGSDLCRGAPSSRRGSCER